MLQFSWNYLYLVIQSCVALHLKLSMVFYFIWLWKFNSFINSVLLPRMFPVQFHDIEYEVVYWRWTELRDLEWVSLCCTWNVMTSTFPCSRGSAVSSHSIWKLLFPTEEAGYKTFPHLCCVGRTLEQMAREHNVLRLETEKFRSPQIERNQSTVPSDAVQTVCRA